MLSGVLLLAAAAAGANTTTLFRLEKLPIAVAARLQQVRCEACGFEHGLVDTWRPALELRDQWAPEGATVDLDIRGGEELRSVIAELGLAHNVSIHDVEAVIAEETSRRLRAVHAKDDFFAEYRTYEEIQDKLTEWIDNYDGVSEFVVGLSIEGRKQRGIKFGSSPENDAIYLQCGIHAREWISPATCMYFTQKLLDGLKNKDEVVTSLLSKTQIYLLPVANPDGYVYTFTNQRLWRKNRRANSGGTFGVDLNRNWDDGHWGLCGASSSPSSDTYKGTAAFSEPETNNVKTFWDQIEAQGVKIQSGIDFHSYGQLLLRPYGWNLPNRACADGSGDGKTCVPWNEAENEAAMTAYLSGIQSSGQSSGRWTSEHAAELYCAAGGTDDWIASRTRQASGFCLELRPSGNPGFTLPASGIVPSGEENYEGVLKFVKVIVDNAEFARRK